MPNPWKNRRRLNQQSGVIELCVDHRSEGVST